MAEGLLRLVEIIMETLQAAFWPGLLIILLLYFGPTLRQLLQNTSEMNLSAGGVELQMKMKMEAAAALGAAQASRAVAGIASVDAANAGEVARIVDKIAEPAALKAYAGARVLWVDDQPSNNLYERRTLEAIGIRTVTASSTEEALDQLARDRITAVISDMGRPPDDRAGYTLLAAMQEQGFLQPFIIYSSSGLPEHRAEARARGALSSTNDPAELFQLVTAAILGAA